MSDKKEVTDKNSVENTGRRKAIKKIAVGVGALATYNALPKQWTSPIVDQIIMPVHAATSGTSLHDPCSITLTSGTQSDAAVTIRVDGYVRSGPNNLNKPISG